VLDAMNVAAWPRQQDYAKDYGSRRRDERKREEEFDSAFHHDSLHEGFCGSVPRNT
jgi:hypothetical protein